MLENRKKLVLVHLQQKTNYHSLFCTNGLKLWFLVHNFTFQKIAAKYSPYIDEYSCLTKLSF